jgi:hypothetical protein
MQPCDSFVDICREGYGVRLTFAIGPIIQTATIGLGDLQQWPKDGRQTLLSR